MDFRIERTEGRGRRGRWLGRGLVFAFILSLAGCSQARQAARPGGAARGVVRKAAAAEGGDRKVPAPEWKCGDRPVGPGEDRTCGGKVRAEARAAHPHHRDPSRRASRRPRAARAGARRLRLPQPGRARRHRRMQLLRLHRQLGRSLGRATRCGRADRRRRRAHRGGAAKQRAARPGRFGRSCSCRAFAAAWVPNEPEANRGGRLSSRC